jgi:hypothetical protein
MINRERIARLTDERTAIEKWDEMYRADETHTTSEEVAYAVRQLTRREIQREIHDLTFDSGRRGAA